ncbi:FtsW/RodA/SpoVE family cell cycle protein [Bernardetia sp.]|uniref:FtsW/RodA/SpoVE family cell cycle protein n=1 Tax=Bernardetia sp. TaxID=1937974 RepID=UPI0025C564C9|nr:FtsW/RodA/SpoVE family cell cycle protein [Bernardetia sp.]
MELDKISKKIFTGDKIIWGVVFLLVIISVLVVYSATGAIAFKRMDGDTEYYLLKHSILLIMSLVIMWVCHRIDYRYYSRLSRLALLISVPLLILTWLFGTTINEASRGIMIPFINQSFQTSDFATLALIANVASMLSKRQQSIREFQRSTLPIIFWSGLICGLIALANFSSAVLLFATCMLIMFIGRVPVRYLVMTVVIGAVVGMIALKLGQRSGTAVSRMKAFFDTEQVTFQEEQSYVAVATGGLIGKGIGNSQQRNFLPHPYSDFIYAIIIEEYGLLGGIIILGLYLILLYRGMVAMANSERAFGGLLSAGLSFSLVVQALVHMGVVVGLVPVTGLPLPLLSMGGTSLFFTGISLGIILSVSRGEYEKTEKEPITPPQTGNNYRRIVHTIE